MRSKLPLVFVTSSLLCGAGAMAQSLTVPDPYRDVDINLLQSGPVNLDMGGLGQVLGLGQIVNDPVLSNDRIYLFMPKARLRLDGSFERYSFNFQLAMGGEDSVNATSGISFGLLDLAINVPVSRDGRTYVKVGQFLVPYGREQLTDPGFQDFADTSMEESGFVVGRDVGVAIVAHPGPISLVGGVFTGGGRDVPPDHYLPQKLGIPELAGRIGFGTLDEDTFYLRQTAAHPSRAGYEISLSGLYTKDSLLGHSTILNVKSVDKSLLIDANWNPYIAQGGTGKFSEGDLAQAGVDVAVRAPLRGGWAFDGEAQADYARYANDYGMIHIWGARAQASILRDPLEFSFRYDVLAPSNQFASNGVAITGSQPIQEITPAVTYFIEGSRLKLILDAPILVHAPVFTEPHVGQYVGTELPDESTVLAAKTGGSVARQTVPQARLMLQAQF